MFCAGRRPRLLVASLVVAVALTGCGGASKPAQVAAAPPPARTAPAYDASLPPTQAVLALVPFTATTLRLTDWAEIHTQFGLPELTARSSDADRVRFWQQARREAPLLSHGRLRRVDVRLRTTYGFGQDDLAWEGRWSGGGSGGWALSFRPGLDMTDVARAVGAGVGPLRGATVDEADHLVVSDTVTGAAWANDDTWDTVSGGTAEATYLGRGCATPVPEALAPLNRFSVSFGDHLVTARLGPERADLFERLQLGRGHHSFTAVYRNGVGDPSSGRIGWIVPHPDRAAREATRGRWPFAGCGQRS